MTSVGALGDRPLWPTRLRDVWLVSSGAIASHVFAYSFANRYPNGAIRQIEMTSLDMLIPFLPWTVFLYLSDYLLVLVAFLSCRLKVEAQRFFFAQLGVLATSVFVHWRYPIAFPRELYPLPADLTPAPALAMTWLRQLDAPTSCVPSLHVASSVLAALLIRRQQPRLFRWLMAWAVVISMSTLTTKQHYLVDVIAGGALACGAFLLAEHFRPHPS